MSTDEMMCICSVIEIILRMKINGIYYCYEIRTYYSACVCVRVCPQIVREVNG